MVQLVIVKMGPVHVGRECRIEQEGITGGLVTGQEFEPVFPVKLKIQLQLVPPSAYFLAALVPMTSIAASAKQPTILFQNCMMVSISSLLTSIPNFSKKMAV